jgi:glycosyltransferase involved in cell wall biosynthesis
MFKVSIDASPILAKPSGVGVYIINLISSLYKLQIQHDFKMEIAYQPSFKNLLLKKTYIPKNISDLSQIHVLPLSRKISKLFSLVSDVPLINYHQRLGMPDVIHGTNYSVFPCRETLNLMTIHDLSCVKYPEYTTLAIQQFPKLIKRSLKWTDGIITVSESSKKDIVEYLQISPDRVFVTPLASRYYVNYLSENQIDRMETEVKYNFSQPYLLFVSTIEPRKNIISIVTAFNILKSKYKIPHNLVLIGQKGWKYEAIFQEIGRSPWKDNIYHLDYLSDRMLALFYTKAAVFVYPSHYEGFGLPVLEAMTLGAPVVIANTSSLPEVAGDAALSIDPADPEALVTAVLEIISDDRLRQQLIDKGKQRSALFSWERTAIETLAAYRSVRKNNH